MAALNIHSRDIEASKVEAFEKLGLSVDLPEVETMRGVISRLYDHGWDPLVERADGTTLLEGVLESYYRDPREYDGENFTAAMILVFSEEGVDFDTRLGDGRTLAEFLLADYAPGLAHGHPEWSAELLEAFSY